MAAGPRDWDFLVWSGEFSMIRRVLHLVLLLSSSASCCAPAYVDSGRAALGGVVDCAGRRTRRTTVE